MKNALAAGCRLFSFTYYDGARGEFGKALERYLPRFKLKRTDIYVQTKFAIPGTKGSGMGAHLDKKVEKCREEMGGYVDAALLHTVPSTFDSLREEIEKSDEAHADWQKALVDAFGVLVECRGMLA